jgi:predicted metal-dependent hydrolase
MDRTTRVALMQQLIADAERLSAAFGLRYRVIEPERPHVRSRYGACYADGTIRIRLRHAVTGRPLKYSSLVNTLCHELAHLTHFNHGPRFKALYLRILDRARAEGIYRPGRPEPEARVDAPAGGPRKAAQLELFEWVERRRR